MASIEEIRKWARKVPVRSKALSKEEIEKEDSEIKRKSAQLRRGLEKEDLERQMRSSRKKAKSLVGSRRMAEYLKFSKARARYRLLAKIIAYKRRGSGNLAEKKK